MFSTSSILNTGRLFIQPDLRFPKRSVYIDGEDVSSWVYGHSVTRQVNEGVGSAEVSLRNKYSRFINKWEGGEIVKVMHDYSDGTYQIFEGKLDDDVPSLSQSEGLLFNAFARDYGAPALECPVTEFYTEPTACSTIFTDLINGYKNEAGMPDWTTVNVETSTATFQPEWEDVMLHQCLKDTAKKAGYLFHCGRESSSSSNWKDWHFFQEGSRKCLTEMVAIKGNLFSLENRGTIRSIVNSQKLYGSPVEGLPVFKTAFNSDSIAKYWKKAKISSEESARTNESVSDRVSAMLADSLDKRRSIAFNSVSLPTVNPGEDLYIAAPECQVNGFKTVKSITHSQSGAGLFMSRTTLEKIIEANLLRVTHLSLRKIVELKNKNNPFGLKNSYLWKFWKYSGDKKVDDSSGIQKSENTQVLDQKLVLSSGYQGRTLLVPFTADADITKFAVKVSADYKIDSCVIEAFLDGGTVPAEIKADSLYTAEEVGLSGKSGTIRFTHKTDTANTSPRVLAIGMYYT